MVIYTRLLHLSHSPIISISIISNISAHCKHFKQTHQLLQMRYGPHVLPGLAEPAFPPRRSAAGPAINEECKLVVGGAPAESGGGSSGVCVCVCWGGGAWQTRSPLRDATWKYAASVFLRHSRWWVLYPPCPGHECSAHLHPIALFVTAPVIPLIHLTGLQEY
jgi:hypothetical protein